MQRHLCLSSAESLTTSVHHAKALSPAFKCTMLPSSLQAPGLVIAEVLMVKKHPKADKLLIVELDNGEDNVQVSICIAGFGRRVDNQPLYLM